VRRAFVVQIKSKCYHLSRRSNATADATVCTAIEDAGERLTVSVSV
jgi:hypothetical protein